MSERQKGFYPIIIPAIAADIKEAIVPPIKAFIPNSDNVLRGGLTPKHVDVPELLKHVVFEETHPNIMLGELQKDGIERIYKSPAPDFELSQIALNSETKYQSIAETAQER